MLCSSGAVGDPGPEIETGKEKGWRSDLDIDHEAENEILGNTENVQEIETENESVIMRIDVKEKGSGKEVKEAIGEVKETESDQRGSDLIVNE